MPRRSDYVRCSGKTGSDWQPTKPSRRTHTGHRRPKSATDTPAGLRNFGVIPGVMNWAVLRDFAFGTHLPSVVANGGIAGGSHEYQANPGSTSRLSQSHRSN